MSTNESNFDRKYQLTEDSLVLLNSLSPREHSLFMSILKGMGRGMSEDEFFCVGDYKTFGYNNSQNFYRDRKSLLSKDLIYFEGDRHVVNPAMVKYSGPKQWAWLRKWSGVAPDYSNNLRVPPPPKQP